MFTMYKLCEFQNMPIRIFLLITSSLGEMKMLSFIILGRKCTMTSEQESGVQIKANERRAVYGGLVMVYPHRQHRNLRIIRYTFEQIYVKL